MTVLCCVSTQFVMMCNSDALDRFDLSSLRVMFTGGEAVPYARAEEFEQRTGCRILQFYGSNETGLLSGTTIDDPTERRLATAGRVVADMHVRLFDGDRDVTASGYGQPACRGPATSVGYLDDPAGNAALFTSDGWMRMGDLCRVDADGYLTVVGRTSDVIIRGGKNISAAEVEAEVATHAAVELVGAVPMRDPLFGERVCVYVQLRPGHDARPRRTGAAPAHTGCRQGTAPRADDRHRRDAALLRRQDREGRAPRRPRGAAPRRTVTTARRRRQIPSFVRAHGGDRFGRAFVVHVGRFLPPRHEQHELTRRAGDHHERIGLLHEPLPAVGRLEEQARPLELALGHEAARLQ